MSDSLLASYLTVWSTAKSKLSEQTEHGEALYYSSILFVASLTALLFIINITELITGGTIALWIHGMAYLLAAYTGFVGWRFGKL